MLKLSNLWLDVKRLNERVKRNINRFPEAFMFQLKASEITDSLKSQFATLNVSENKRGIADVLGMESFSKFHKFCCKRRSLIIE